MSFSSPRMVAATLLASLVLGGCASTASGYYPIVDGPRSAAFYDDLDDCQALARTKRSDNDDTQTSALVGAVIGGAIGATDDELIEGAIVGGLLGALVGSAEGASNNRKDQKDIVVRCMYERGHPVVG